MNCENSEGICVHIYRVYFFDLPSSGDDGAGKQVKNLCLICANCAHSRLQN